MSLQNGPIRALPEKLLRQAFHLKQINEKDHKRSVLQLPSLSGFQWNTIKKIFIFYCWYYFSFYSTQVFISWCNNIQEGPRLVSLQIEALQKKSFEIGSPI